MFSTTTCKYCHQDLAEFAKLPKPPVDLLVVVRGEGDLPQDVPSWATMIRDETGSISGALGISRFPTYMAVDKTNKVKFTHTGGLAATQFQNSEVLKWLTSEQ